MNPINLQKINGSPGIILLALFTILVGGLSAYFTTQVSFTAELERRPTRQEITNLRAETIAMIQRELDDIKGRIIENTDSLDQLNTTMTNFILRRNQGGE